MATEIISLPSVDYKNIIHVDGTETIEFFDDYIINSGHRKFTDTSDPAIPQEQQSDFEFFIFKKGIVSIDRYYDYESDQCWKTVINFQGYRYEFIMKSKTAASALAKKFFQWITT